jgi:hypothetical protein
MLVVGVRGRVHDAGGRPQFEQATPGARCALIVRRSVGSATGRQAGETPDADDDSEEERSGT